MATGFQALTEKEKQTLRLIVRGHDAKSLARHLGLSVHTINERLRDARRKLEVSSSREAARLLLDSEGEDAQRLGDRRMGEAGGAASAPKPDAPEDSEASASRGASRAGWLIIGALLMSIMLAILALAGAPQSAGVSASAEATAAAPLAESEAARTARDWLALHDDGRWRETWDGTSASFRKLDSLQLWTETAQKVRPPLGALISRTLISQEDVPAPPAGVHVVKFRTSFANKADAVETVSLAREDGTWKVVGIYIE